MKRLVPIMTAILAVVVSFVLADENEDTTVENREGDPSPGAADTEHHDDAGKRHTRETAGESESAGDVIGHIEGRAHRITIHAGDEKEHYSVYDKDGVLVGRELTDTELSAQYPDMYELINEGLAGETFMMLFDQPADSAPAPVIMRDPGSDE